MITTTRMLARALLPGVSYLAVLVCLMATAGVASAQRSAPHGHDRSGRDGFAVTPQHAPGHPGLRGSAQILFDMDTDLAQIEQMSFALDNLSRGRLTRGERARMRRLSRRMRALSTNLQELRRELDDALARERRARRPRRPGHPHHPHPGHPGHPHHPHPGQPPVIDPPVSIPAPPVGIPEHSGPYPMSPADFGALTQRLHAQGMESQRLGMLRDAVQAGAHFDTGQAVQIMGMFGFDRNKVDAGVLLCPVITERGPLPRMSAVLRFESSRKALRARTGGRCGRY